MYSLRLISKGRSCWVKTMIRCCGGRFINRSNQVWCDLGFRLVKSAKYVETAQRKKETERRV